MKRFEVTVKVTSTKGMCRANLKVGDVFKVSPLSPGGMCGAAYHAIFPMLLTLSCDGKPRQGDDPNKVEGCCPDFKNLVTFDIIRKEIDE